MLLEKVNGKQASTQQGEPVALAPRIGAGRLVRYFVRAEQEVSKGDTIAKVTDFENTPWEITAPRAGKIASLPFRNGDTFPAEAAIAYLVSNTPEAPRKPAPVAPTNHTQPPAKTQPAPSGEALRPIEQPAKPNLAQQEQAQQVSGPAHNGRRSTMPPVLEVTEIEPDEVPQPKKRPKRPKIIRKTCRPTDQQERELIKLMDALEKEGFDYSEGELHRMMFDWLLGLSRRELVARAETNRDKEQAGRYGWGARPQA